MKILFWIMIGLAAVLTVWFLLKLLASVILYKHGIELYGSRDSLMLHVRTDGISNVVIEIKDYMDRKTESYENEIAEIKEEFAKNRKKTRLLKKERRLLIKETRFFNKLTKKYKDLTSEIENQCDGN